MVKSRRFLIGIGAFFVMLLCLFFFFNPPVSAKAEENASYTTDYSIYSNGMYYEEKEGLGYSVYTSAFYLNSYQYEQMVTEFSDFNKPCGSLYFCRTTDSYLYGVLCDYQDEYVVGISSGYDYYVSTTTQFLSDYLDKIEYVHFAYDFESETFGYTSNSDLAFGTSDFESFESGARYSSFTAYFKETSETVNNTYYYFSFYNRHHESLDLSDSSTVPIDTIVAHSNCITESTGDYIRANLSAISNYPGHEIQADYWTRQYKILGQYKDTPATVRLNYKKYDPNQLAVVDDVLEISIDPLYRNASEVLAIQLAKSLEGFEYESILLKEALPYFDVDFQESTTYLDDDGNQFSTATKNETLLVAESIEFVDDFTDNDNVVEFNVIYDDYDHSKFYINLTNNDLENYLELKTNSSDFVVSGNKGYLTFDFNTIENQSMVLLKWLFDLGLNTEGNLFRVTYQGAEVSFIKSYDSQDREVHTYTMEEGGIVVKITDDVNLQLIYELEEDGIYPAYDIFNVGIEVMAEIIEDYYVYFQYKYYSYSLVDNKIVVGDHTETDWTAPILFSSARMFLNAENVKSYYPQVVSAIDLPFTYATIAPSGTEYYPGFSDKLIEGTDEYYKIYGVSLNYIYSPVFMVTQQLPTGDDVKYFNISKLNSLYNGLDFVDEIPDGYRVSKIYSQNQDAVEVVMPSASVEKPTWLDVNFYLNVKASDEVIVPINVEYSNIWNVKLNYLKKYNDSPFGTYQTLNFSVPVSGYSNYKEYEKVDADGNVIKLKAPTLASLSKSNIEELSQTKIDGLNAGILSITSKWSSVTQNLTVNYGGRTVVQSVPNGSNISRTIPLTSFGEWCDALGVKWDIMYLNTSGASHGASTYFESADEVSPYDLYGFFTLATFSKSSPWNKLTDVELDSDYAVMTYFVDRYFGSELRVISNNLGAQFLGETVENSSSKDYSTFFTFVDTTIAKDGFVSVDGVVDVKNATKTSSGGCSCGLFSCDNIGNLLFIVLICFGAVIVLAVIIKAVRWAKR